jgi:anaerobic ribonucleoside-triphosphate reductase activating protein
MNYADIKTVDIQDGEGIRVSIYVSGCHFHCKGCHNKEAWDFEFGKKFDETTIDYILELLNHDYIAGLSLLGGEPLEKVNQQGLVPLVKAVKEKYPNKNIWCYTGYDFEKDILGKMYEENDYTRDLINNIDIMVDGEFVEEKKLTDLKFRGSTNQRKIDVKASLKEKKVVTLKFGDEARYEVKEPKIVLFEEYVTKNENIEEETIPVTAGAIYSINNDKKVETEIQKETVKISAKQKSNFPNENLD